MTEIVGQFQNLSEMTERPTLFVKTVSDLKNDKGEWITNDKDKATELNEFFSSVFTKEEDDELPDFSSKTDSSNFNK